MRRFFASFLSSLLMCQTVFAGKLSKNIIEDEVIVTADKLNVRTGAGEGFPSVGYAGFGDTLRVVGMLDDWYIVLLPDSSVGVVSYKFVKVSKLRKIPAKTAQGADDSEDAGEITDADKLFDMINRTRTENNLTPFAQDDVLSKAAEIKARDMVTEDYFGHNSPVYGTPFAMLKKMDIEYKSASENIAKNISVENAYLEIMDSISKRGNLYNAKFDKIGIGVHDSTDWGKTIVLLFIESR
ncbi:hypothetical protein FACS1894188_06870 [Clostridia bacterium]|nr:hypothetical protein FACS1894188_06870 [Clostridia bacterium]